MEKRLPLLVLAIIAVVSIIGFAKLLNTSTTGQYQYAGGSIQYETSDVCTQVNCAMGDARLIRIDSSDIAPQFMIAQCECPENPGVLYPAKFIKPIISYGY
ncbi:hypothetical protein GF358_04220 [Candidatus Woesearchaeota archaeon]|nr:hypothetical protein [Candidatus Woesearchaeota archaeon]